MPKVELVALGGFYRRLVWMLAYFVNVIRNCGRLYIEPHCWDLETRGFTYISYILRRSDERLADD